MPGVDQVRNALQGNKIFFETVAAAALTAMSLILSCNSLRVSKSSLEVSKQQLALTEMEAAPIFRVNHETLFMGDVNPHSEEARYTSSLAELYNDGTPITDIRIQSKTVFGLFEPGSGRKWIPVYDPVHREHRYEEGKAVKTGLLVSFREEAWVLAAYGDFLKKISAACESKALESCRALRGADMETVAELSYADKFNVQKKFYISLFSANMPDKQEDLQELYEKISKLNFERTRQDFATSTPDTILGWASK